MDIRAEEQRGAAEYMDVTLGIAARAAETQRVKVVEAAEAVCRALEDGRRFWAFGTGHSHTLVEEIFGRAGGLREVTPILEPSLMLHEGLEKSSLLERLPGLAATLLDVHPVQSGDVLLVISNSGRNPVPVEMAELARARGATVIALTSLAHSHAVDSRAPSGAKLWEVADIVLDNCGVPGDAVIAQEPHPVGPTSTVIGALLLQALIVQVAATMAARGEPLDTYLSLNV